jgi:hypothetical protein
VILNSASFDNYDYWALLEYVEDIGHALETVNNISKWLRSSIIGIGNQANVRVDIMAEQGEGLESIERNKIRSIEYNDSWVQTALENELREEDYDLSGGYIIRAVFKNNASIFLNSVVDNIDSAEKTYGKDIDRNIGWSDDDLNVLEYKDTILQSADILTGLRKGDDPSFPDRGINPKILVGSNIAAISYPTIFRDLAASFATDDSFKSFGITKIKREQDSLEIEFRVSTRAGDTFNRSSQVV